MQKLDADKALDIEVINLASHVNHVPIADFMIVASGQSSRQVIGIAQKLIESVKHAHHDVIATEGLDQGDWVIVDLGDIVIHLFRPEVRDFYNIEKMWRTDGALEIVGDSTIFG